MAKSTKKTAKKVSSSKKSPKTARNRGRITENVDCLLELHKLQGVLLKQLRKDI